MVMDPNRCHSYLTICLQKKCSRDQTWVQGEPFTGDLVIKKGGVNFRIVHQSGPYTYTAFFRLPYLILACFARLQRTRNPFYFLVHFSTFTLVYFFAFTYCFGVLLLFSYTFSFLCLQRIAARLQRTRYGFHFYLLVLWSGGGNYAVFSPRPPGFSELKLRLSVAGKNSSQRIRAAARAEHGPLSPPKRPNSP